ncbi:hypothetical protein HRbin25_00447 [bacterium HR25]|nr:hypothetical protein HRbin25_00447 [bacterium HR25]
MGQAGLAAPGQAAGDEQDGPVPAGVAAGQLEVAAGQGPRLLPLGGRHLRLAEAEALHLTPHRRPVTAVEVQHLEHLAVPGRLYVAPDEGLRQVRPAPELQVHGQEGHVSRHVRVTEATVELDAVHDARFPLGGEVDAVAAEVAMAVADAALGGPPAEQEATASEEPVHVAPQQSVLLLAYRLADEVLPLLEVLPPGEADPPGAQAGDGGAVIGPGVDRRQPLRYRLDEGGGRLSSCQQGGQEPLLRHPPHLHGVLHRAAGAVQRELTVPLPYSDDAQIGAGAETAVEADLLPAVVAAPGQG